MQNRIPPRRNTLVRKRSHSPITGSLSRRGTRRGALAPARAQIISSETKREQSSGERLSKDVKKLEKLRHKREKKNELLESLIGTVNDLIQKIKKDDKIESDLRQQIPKGNSFRFVLDESLDRSNSSTRISKKRRVFSPIFQKGDIKQNLQNLQKKNDNKRNMNYTEKYEYYIKNSSQKKNLLNKNIPFINSNTKNSFKNKISMKNNFHNNFNNNKENIFNQDISVDNTAYGNINNSNSERKFSREKIEKEFLTQKEIFSYKNKKTFNKKKAKVESSPKCDKNSVSGPQIATEMRHLELSLAESYDEATFQKFIDKIDDALEQCGEMDQDFKESAKKTKELLQSLKKSKEGSKERTSRITLDSFEKLEKRFNELDLDSSRMFQTGRKEPEIDEEESFEIYKEPFYSSNSPKVSNSNFLLEEHNFKAEEVINSDRSRPVFRTKLENFENRKNVLEKEKYEKSFIPLKNPIKNSKFQVKNIIHKNSNESSHGLVQPDYKPDQPFLNYSEPQFPVTNQKLTKINEGNVSILDYDTFGKKNQRELSVNNIKQEAEGRRPSVDSFSGIGLVLKEKNEQPEKKNNLELKNKLEYNKTDLLVGEDIKEKEKVENYPIEFCLELLYLKLVELGNKLCYIRKAAQRSLKKSIPLAVGMIKEFKAEVENLGEVKTRLSTDFWVEIGEFLSEAKKMEKLVKIEFKSEISLALKRSLCKEIAKVEKKLKEEAGKLEQLVLVNFGSLDQNVEFSIEKTSSKKK